MKRKGLRIVTAVAAALSALVVTAGVALCMVFPNKYATELNAAADEFGLDRALVRSVVWAESKFDPNARSDKGASGLMQLMPETYKACAVSLGIEDAENKIFDPQTSLRCGCYYLSLMIDKFDGYITAALMAYNAGEQNARKFLAGENVFPETRKYLSDIRSAKFVYGLFR